MRAPPVRVRRSRPCWPTGSPAPTPSDPRPRDVSDEQGKSADNPWPVRAVATRVAKYIDRLGMVWIEGQLTELKLRQNTAWMVLRDPAADMSLSVSCPRDLVANAPVALSEGTQVIVLGKPQFYTRNGSFSLRISEIRAVGIGELLARIERLRRLLDAEGLFDPRLKRPIPFLPGTIGLITGRASAAEHDVVAVATNRWPAVRFAVRNAAVQGPNAVPQIVEALRALDRDDAVDVIVLARGGGSVEDLLPFSDETLCREIAKCTTPVVSAVGHEPDNPLSDLVADLRAATPTDAAKRIVPDAAAEQALVADLRMRSARALRNWVNREQHHLTQLRSRPVLAQPLQALEARAADVHRARTAGRRDVARLVAVESERIGHLSARLMTLGPAATLARGYAVVQTVSAGDEAHVLRTTADAPAGAQLRIRVADGAVNAVSTGADEE
ncbi:exodeoxyribonuclease VII large subunit [Mycobacterium sp. WMMD1722]|uniref:exodeoxyribonuclease VII large subunit n=1 Tax=Mycobacterium sp. WMMD1722 TaxID=3404117 RepID=UPI003BF61D3C